MKVVVRATLLAAAAFSATAALAQPKPALVKDVDFPARASYQQTVNSTGCLGNFTCEVNFPVVPAGKRLVVTWVNVFYALPSVAGDSWGYLDVQGSPVQFFLQPAPSAVPTLSRMINTATLLYVDAGSSPRMIFGTLSPYDSEVQVTLAGYYVSVP